VNSTRIPPMPRGKHRTIAALEDGYGTVVEITVNWEYMRDIARKARDSKGRRSTMGPVLIKAVQP
jgi:hypothetical protein